MVKKLFWENPLQDTCTAKVTSITKNVNNENTTFVIQLDQTIFYAFSGGQASDQGTMNNLNVKTATKVGNDIHYELESEPDFKVGDSVEIKIDLARRKNLMRLHCAAHVVCFLFEDMTGLAPGDAIGSSVDPHKARLDYKYPQNISHVFEELTKKANEVFTKNHPIETFANKDDPNRREWECKSLNQACPCAGTHVSNTNQIGKIKLKRKNTGSGKERIEIMLA